MRKKKTATGASTLDNIPRIKVIEGPHKGTSYKLVAGKVTIGRSSDNDIVLIDDDKCSRKQAIISLESNNTYFIKDVSKKGSIQINDISKIKSDLQDGDLIQFGSSVLQFVFSGAKNIQSPAAATPAPINPVQENTNPPEMNNSQQLVPVAPSSQPIIGGQLATGPTNADNLPSLQKDNNLPNVHMNPGIPNYNHPPGYQNPHIQTPPLKKKAQRKKSLAPKVIVVGLIIGGAWFFSQDVKEKIKKEDNIRTMQDMEEEIKTLTELKDQELQKRNKNLDQNYQYAQSAYIKGLRDYRKGVYIRAVESFRVCKTLYPQHELCPAYLKKAQAKNQQLIQAWMVAGKDYREKRRFVSCMSSFKNVMTAIKNQKNHTYKEAKENFKICQIQYEDRY